MKIFYIHQGHIGQSKEQTVSLLDGWCSKCDAHHIPKISDSRNFAYDTTCPKLRPWVLPLLVIGNAGTGVGSRITGHARRGGKKLRQEHIRHCPIALTDEYRTSKTCIFCFQQVALARSSRIVQGKIKSVRVHGAVECMNQNCISVKQGHGIKARDSHSAIAIAISGASILFNPVRRVLPPFSRSHDETKFTKNASNMLEDSPSSLGCPSVDTTETPCCEQGLCKFQFLLIYIYIFYFFFAMAMLPLIGAFTFLN